MVDGWMDGGMGGWMEGWRDQWIRGWIEEGRDNHNYSIRGRNTNTTHTLMSCI